jgi:hypothetical protein
MELRTKIWALASRLKYPGLLPLLGALVLLEQVAVFSGFSGEAP